VKTGPVTLTALAETGEGHLKFLTAEGESLPGPILKIGNTNSRIRFALPPGDFVTAWSEEGPTHHCAMGAGHVAGEIDKLAQLLRLRAVRVAALECMYQEWADDCGVVLWEQLKRR